MGYLDVPPELIAFLDRYDAFFLMGHIDPDGDCIGAQMVMASFLRRRGKTAHLFSPGPFNRKEIRAYGGYFLDRVPAELQRLRAGVFVLDCATRDRIGGLAQDLAGRETAVVDHHSAGDQDFGDIRYIEPRAPSVTLLVQKIMEAAGDTPTPEEARKLFVGFATDTGFFRHLETEAGEALRMVARLADRGITPRSVYRETYGSHSLESRFFIADALRTTETFHDGKLLLVHELRDHSRSFQGENRQTDQVYQLLLSVEGCQALAFIREEPDDTTSVSLRSVDSVDVGKIARDFGGGGHRNAAGFSTRESYLETRPRIIEAFGSLFDPADGNPVSR